jgi:hypothetical protein
MQFGDNGPNLGFGSPTWIFTRQNVSEGLGVGAAAVGSAFTFGLWDGGNASCDASFQVSRTLGGIGRDALLSTVPVDRLLNGFAPDAAEMAANTLRFTEGTPVQMADGRVRPIQTVKTGDLVQTKDPQTGKIGAGKVTKTSVRQAPATVALKFSTGEVIECTPEHPFYVDGVGFAPAGRLGIGTSIVTRAGPVVQVTKVERHDKPATVYNFTVEDSHTYFVGTANGGLWVHNDCWRLQPNEDAVGPHSSFKYDDTGRVIHYETYKPNDHVEAGWITEKRFDGVGRSHFDKGSGEYIDTPHVHAPNKPNGPLDNVRRPGVEEYPHGY